MAGILGLRKAKKGRKGRRIYGVATQFAGAGLMAFLLAGCLQGKNVGNGTAIYCESPPTRISSVSHLVVYQNGGQTIALPQKMADATTLWRPLTAQEQRHMALLHKKAGQTIQSGMTGKTGRALAANTPKPLSTEGIEKNLSIAGAFVGGLSQQAASWLPDSGQLVMEEYLYRLTVTHAAVTERSLARASKYLPYIRQKTAEMGLPVELACLPLVESAFEPQAISPAGAAGLWQLMPATARRFGLIVNKQTDERLDVEKSTVAALQYLAFLYAYFEDWPLAIAAYNSGEGTMKKAMARSGSRTFHELVGKCLDGGSQALQEETIRFVPQFVAAIEVMNSSRYLFSVQGALQQKRSAPVLETASASTQVQTQGAVVEPVQIARQGAMTDVVVSARADVPSSRKIRQQSQQATMHKKAVAGQTITAAQVRPLQTGTTTDSRSGVPRMRRIGATQLFDQE